MLVIFVIGIIVSPILTWAFDLSGWLWGTSWLLTGLSLAIMLFDDSLSAGFIAVGIVAAPLLTWGFDVSPWLWGMAWLSTGTLILSAMKFEYAPQAGILGFIVMAIGIIASSDSQATWGDCIQYAAMEYREAYQTNNCADILADR